MRIAVAPTPTAVEALVTSGEEPDVLVLWERIKAEDASRIAQQFPTSITVSGECRGQRICGVVRHGQKEVASYEKIGDDGYHGCSGPRLTSLNINSYLDQGRDLGVSVLVCMDINEPVVADKLLEMWRSARRPLMVLAIPAHMSSDYFSSPQLSERFAGLTVALCNGRQGAGAVNSFISDRTTRMKRPIVQGVGGLLVTTLDYPSIPSSSPLASATQAIREAPFRWAPAGAQSLDQYCQTQGITYGFTDSNKGPEVADGTHVELPVFFLENLWAFCFASWAITVHVEKRRAEQGRKIELGNSGDALAARLLLEWSINRNESGMRLPYPQGVPLPDFSAAIGTTKNSANVLFCTATAYILHHEIAHIQHGLEASSSDAAENRQQEITADMIAAASLDLGSGAVANEQETNHLGIALAHLFEVVVHAFTVESCRRHGHVVPDSILGHGSANHPAAAVRLRGFMNLHHANPNGATHAVLHNIIRLVCTRLNLPNLQMDFETWQDGWMNDLARIEAYMSSARQ